MGRVGRIRIYSVGYLVFFLTCLFPAVATFAQTQTQGESFNNQIDMYLRYLPQRSAESQPGKVEVIQSEIEYGYTYKVFDVLPVKFSLENQYIGIEESVAVDIPAHLIRLAVGMETTIPFFSFDTSMFSRSSDGQ